MRMNDDFFLGWLAREVRFQVGIHFRQRQYLGYTVYRRVLTTKKDEPAMNMWLAEKGVYGRVLKNAEQIARLIEILSPAREYIVDQNGLANYLRVADVKNRFLTHEGLLEVLHILESCES
jgi:hypothetical protein